MEVVGECEVSEEDEGQVRVGVQQEHQQQTRGSIAFAIINKEKQITQPSYTEVGKQEDVGVDEQNERIE